MKDRKTRSTHFEKISKIFQLKWGKLVNGINFNLSKIYILVEGNKIGYKIKLVTK